MILYAAADLLWATRIKATADALGVPCRPARNAEMLRARLADSPVRALIVDLEAEAGLDLIALARVEGGPRVRVVASGPHVQKDRLQAARDAGADEVLTRGAFDHALPDLLLALGGGGHGAGGA